MITYEYNGNLLESGYTWNVLQRINNSIGVHPFNVSYTGMFTIVQFENELSVDDKMVLDEIMTSNPTYPPYNSGTTFLIDDIWNKRSEIVAAMGLPFDVYFSESVIGSKDIDQIELHFNELNQTHKNKVLTIFSQLIREKGE